MAAGLMPIMNELLREADASFEPWAPESHSFSATHCSDQLAYHSRIPNAVRAYMNSIVIVVVDNNNQYVKTSSAQNTILYDLMQTVHENISGALFINFPFIRLAKVTFHFCHIDGLMHERHNSIANAPELRPSCTYHRYIPSQPHIKLWDVVIQPWLNRRLEHGGETILHTKQWMKYFSRP